MRWRLPGSNGMVGIFDSAFGHVQSHSIISPEEGTVGDHRLLDCSIQYLAGNDYAWTG